MGRKDKQIAARVRISLGIDAPTCETCRWRATPPFQSGRPTSHNPCRHVSAAEDGIGPWKWMINNRKDKIGPYNSSPWTDQCGVAGKYWEPDDE